MIRLNRDSNFFNISILILLNFAIFFNYWIGYSTPPWDFLGGGQVEQFRFYKDGGFFNPPSWYPYAWFGIPEYQMLQDGGWFLPVAFVAEFFLWSPPNAARTQAFIILFGSIGAYFLSSRIVFSKQIALIAGILYTFIPVFYSNAQHYGVVRSAAFLPWVLFLLHAKTILNSKFIPLIGTLLIFQAIVGSYPGNLISLFYTSLIFILYQFFTLNSNKIKYLFSVGMISFASLLMGMLRYLPVLTNLNSFPENMGNQAGITFYNLIFTIYPFIGDNLPWADPSLRSLYIGPIVLVSLFFMNIRDKRNLIWVILSSTSVLFMMQNQLNNFLRDFVPFANISRFGISDWRNTFNLSLIMISVLTLEYLFVKNKKMKKINYMLILTVVIYFIYLGITYKYSLITIAFYTISILVILVILSFKKDKKFIFLITSSAILFGYTFVVDNNFSWSTTVKEQYFNIYKTDYSKIQDYVKYPLAKRPARFFFHKPPLIPEQYKNDQRYNRFWLTGEFGALGYHNIKDISAYSALFTRLEKVSDPVIKFLSLESRQIGITNEKNILSQINACNYNKDCFENSNIDIVQREFGKEIEKFKIKSTSDFIMIQNEMYSPVWIGKICYKSGECEEIQSVAYVESLRGWNLPKGEYEFETLAKTPYENVRWLMFYIGVFISIMFGFFHLNQRSSSIK